MMTERPEALSGMLGSPLLAGAAFTRLEASAPWGFTSPGGRPARTELVLVARGGATLRLPDARVVELAEGDLYVLPEDVPYTLGAGAVPALPCHDVEARKERDVIVLGGGGPRTTLLGGAFSFDPRHAAPLGSLFAGFARLRLAPDAVATVASLLRMLGEEVARPGLASSFLVTRLYEALCVQALRATPGPGWLADRQLARAIDAMHEAPERPWSLAELARRAGMSRSAFALRFRVAFGTTPLAWLTRHRMQHAAGLLRGGRSVAEAAAAVGYASESGFGRVFKRELGMSPGRYGGLRRNRLPARPPRLSKAT